MTDSPSRGVAKKGETKPPLRKRIWHGLREWMANNQWLTGALAWMFVGFLWLVRSTNKLVHDDRPKISEPIDRGEALIFTCWHGQHFMMPMLLYKGEPSAMMVSRSRDAELNAVVLEKVGIKAMRGSGGRVRDQATKKGGAKALIGLNQHLRDGGSVAFIADVPKGTPRHASMGTITLARISGCPIIPTAYATSRRKVFERAWDKAAFNLPFGKAALVMGEPVHVAHDADDKAMEDARKLLQTRLNQITETAYAAVDGKNDFGGMKA